MPKTTYTQTDVVQRFFEALDHLLEAGRIDSLSQFTEKYKIVRPNLIRLRSDPERKFNLRYLTILVTDFDIKADWLLTGRGKRGF